ncbi:MAG: hypothetical protein ACTHJW_12400 [Streptosporangiaceae bacterium]
MSSPSVVFSMTSEGKTVAEALIADHEQARELLGAARESGSDLVWAHSAADLSDLGFTRQWGYRKMSGQPVSGRAAAGIVPLADDEDGPDLWAAAYRGQWGHKTPQPDQWPFELPPGTVTLTLRRNGTIAGVCRVDPATGLIDAPGIVPAYRAELSGYEALLRAALGLVSAPSAAVESWGEGPERLAVCERLGLTTADYTPGWELVLRGNPDGRPPMLHRISEAGG